MTHQIVGQHGKPLGRFRGQEVPHIEDVQTQIRFQFLDPVLSGFATSRLGEDQIQISRAKRMEGISTLAQMLAFNR